MTLLGIDVSRWQDDNSTPQMVDFNRARSAGANYVFIKASQSTWMDQDILKNWQNARAAGVPRGAYHFLDWTTTGAAQGKFFAGVLKNDSGELTPVIDYECRANIQGKKAATEGLYAACNTVEIALGRRVMIYTGPSYWREFWDGTHADYFAARPLWIANYGVAKPAIPAPWKDWMFWQYSAKGDGLKFGAESKDLDMDYYNGDLAAFNAAFGLAHEPTDHEILLDLVKRVEALEGKLWIS